MTLNNHKDTIVIATLKSWNLNLAEKLRSNLKNKFNVIIINNKANLSPTALSKLEPKYVFFPHWSYIIPRSIWSNYTCIVFHMTDLPFGRGGSPLQNLLVHGLSQTKISALKVDAGIDTGPIYLKKKLSLKGTANQILIRAAKIIFSKMIPEILNHNPSPIAQTGLITTFSRRKPEQSDMMKTSFKSLEEIFDFIRMLDGEGYPAANLELKNNFKVALTQAKLSATQITGKFTITYEK